MKALKLKKSNLPELQKEHVKLLYRQGYSINEIIEEVDMNYAQIQNYLITEGILKKSRKLPHKTKEKLISKLFKKGKTAREIGIELKIKPKVVKYILKKLNLIDTKHYYGGQAFNSIKALEIFRKKLGITVRQDYDMGKSIQEIMSEYKISLKSVNLFLTGKKD